MRKFTAILFLVTCLVFVVSGCCKFKQCDCVVANVELQLNAASNWCEWDSSYSRFVYVYDGNWQATSEFRFDSQCKAWLYVDALPRHVVFFNDTAAVDTLSIWSATIEQADGDKCCDCNQTVTQFEYTLDGVPHTQTGRVVTLPF